ncbi:uncharacterized protein LTR77_006758 [Saxophila tyrrhenica]|uniref:Major facilitator superfamily (MFS) profile domain-containing protein n=1 Tax=Saxophila tyrrhenica TaxID=1690608 RepID=A0AAV9P8M9_9PEZI|nr:hypothetical protein LTR77_006758 [Saxophila tyrrhenica]
MFDDLRGRPLTWSVTAACASAYLLFGYDQGVLGGLVTQPTFLSAMGDPSSLYLGTIVALYNIGCLAGCVVAAVWGNKAGRRNSVLWACVVMLIGAIIQFTAYGAPQMIAGRLISGVGNGVNTSTVGIYISEISPAARRGRGVAAQLSCVIFGTVMAYWIDYGTIRSLSGSIVWRFPIAFQCIFLIVTIIMLTFLPDTPRWLFAAGRKVESVDVLSRLLDLPPDSAEVRGIENEMQAAWELEKMNGEFKWSSLWREKSDVKKTRRLVLCFMIYLFQMFTGINVIAFYVTIVLEVYVGFDRETSSLVAGCIQIAFWLGTLPPLWTLDRFGRRKTMIWGGIGLSVALIIFTSGIAVATPASSRMALAFLFLFEIMFGMSWDTIPWVYAAEITPLDIRHIGTAIGAFSEWLWTFVSVPEIMVGRLQPLTPRKVVAMITPYAIESLGWKYYLLYCIMTVLAVVFTYFFVPETANKTLEEIDYVFCKDGSPPSIHQGGQISGESLMMGKQQTSSGKFEHGAEQV